MLKTSATHPLRIDEIPAGSRGTIGMTLCPGRKGSSLEGGAWDRDFELDLDIVRAWKPDLVLSLLENHEYAALEIPTFKSDAVASGLPWIFSEIRDGGVPDVTFEREWVSLGARIHSYLDAGGRVLLHCRAGLGRTGLVAAKILVEYGMEPEAAIEAVRAARHGTIETQPQEEYVRAGRSGAES